MTIIANPRFGWMYSQQQLSFDILLCQYSLNFSIGTMIGKVKKKNVFVVC